MKSIPSPFFLTVLPALALLFGGCVSPSGERDRGAETAPENYTALDAAALNHRGPVSFSRQVKPVLETKCLACHSGGAAPPGGYRLDSRKFAMMSDSAGTPRIVPGRPQRSRFLSLAGTHRNVAVMPAVGNRLTPAESRILRRWIAEGAQWPEGGAGVLRARDTGLRMEQQ